MKTEVRGSDMTVQSNVRSARGSAFYIVGHYYSMLPCAAESDSETKEEADASPAAASSGPSLPSSHIVKEADGRVRRRAVFQEATQPVEEADGNEEEGDDQECEHEDTASMGESEDSKGNC